ncbi:hypothetical protein CERZMDRAFT_81017 [Cercospora zeae-maydis SCOH1-5]|uniref:Uncharacterized protein n=1 Tax=Cercospora zeae-maydis SCOH1-5 TaxID=717836 RepID=A0A6A6FUM3_9PEZI|nr:hypothetical protein CERZMDRAFT_81017 [Cercospora zeae-maydis SCOH1-5]
MPVLLQYASTPICLPQCLLLLYCCYCTVSARIRQALHLAFLSFPLQYRHGAGPSKMLPSLWTCCSTHDHGRSEGRRIDYPNSHDDVTSTLRYDWQLLFCERAASSTPCLGIQRCSLARSMPHGPLQGCNASDAGPVHLGVYRHLASPCLGT